MIELLLNVARAHHSAGRTAEAEGLYQQILIEQPDHADALNRLGVLLLQTRRFDAAVVKLRQASKAEPANAAILCNLGEALRQTHAIEGAIDTLRRAVKLQPQLATAHMNLAAALLDDDRPADALVSADTSLAIDPTSAEAHNNRGNALKDLCRWSEAIEAYRTALSLRPLLAAAYSNLGVVLAHENDLPAAIAHYQKAIEIDPNYADAFGNLANALAASGDLNTALLAARRGVNLSPDDVHGHWNLAVVLLSRGDYSAGWEEYEWRFRARGDTSIARFAMSCWNGEDLTGKTILLHAEQGFGDAIQFVRYAPLVADRAARVVLECHPELVSLFKTVPGPLQVIAGGQAPQEADFHCPLMSLPRLFHTTLTTIPRAVPYLRVESIPKSCRFTVGLVWAGNPKHKNDARRSLRFVQLAPLLRLDAEFVSLQRGSSEGLPSGVGDNFLQTATTVTRLDLVIAVDTAVAHLAGALGVPTWVLLPAGPDWRWMSDRTDSPWYPTVRLFRQTVRDDWTEVIDHVAAALADHIAQREHTC